MLAAPQRISCQVLVVGNAKKWEGPVSETNHKRIVSQLSEQAVTW